MSDIRGYDVHYINKLEADIERLRASLKKYQYPPEHRVSVAEARIAELESALREIHALYSDQGFTGLDEVLAQALKEG